MFKTVHPLIFSFDVEWVPDPLAAARLFNCPISTPGEREQAILRLWDHGGATEENPQPYLKTVLCRVVTLAGILREKKPGVDRPSLRMISLPLHLDAPWDQQEKSILHGFFEAVGSKKPQLVGYNSSEADVPILVQRGIINGLSCPGFAQRPDKPWEGVDYFSTHGDHSVDLAPMLGRYRQMPALNEVARLSGIPGKMDTSGGGVAELWLEGRLDEILAYNECDALTTHLVWARFAHFGGFLSDKEYATEQEAVRELIHSLIQNGKPTLQRFLDEWNRLEAIQPDPNLS